MKVLVRLPLALATVATVVVLREAAMTRHTPVHPDTEMHVLVAATSNVAEAKLPEMVTALFFFCQLQVATDPVGAPTDLGSDTFLLRVQPTLDDGDKRQLAGCLEDATIDRLQARVLSIRQGPTGGPAGT